MTYHPSFWLSGHPRPKGSWTPVVTKSGIKFRPASNKTTIWCKSIEGQLQALWKPEPLLGPVDVKLEFKLPRLKTVKRWAPSSRYEGDLDKLIRGVLDAMTGIVFADDSQVVGLVATKRYADTEPGVWVHVLDDL